MPARTTHGKPPRFDVQIGDALRCTDSPDETRRFLARCAARLDKWPGRVSVTDTTTGRTFSPGTLADCIALNIVQP